MSLEEHYIQKCREVSDIFEHLPTLRKYTEECDSVVECGVRNIVSSFAFATGLKGRTNEYVMVDPYKSPHIDSFISLCKREGVNARFIHESDLKCPLVETDLLFIDTWHVYAQLKRELEYWNASVKKYIVMHDTTVDEFAGETIRAGWDANKQSRETGFPVHEIRKGLWPAITEFLTAHPEWVLEKRYTNNNGLTILKRVS